MNAVERGVVLSTADYIDEDALPIIFNSASSPTDASHQGDKYSDTSLDEVEKKTILKTLDLTNGNKSEAARRLGITRRTLHKKLKVYGVMP
jgi:two-component system response regulator HydG